MDKLAVGAEWTTDIFNGNLISQEKGVTENNKQLFPPENIIEMTNMIGKIFTITLHVETYLNTV